MDRRAPRRAREASRSEAELVGSGAVQTAAKRSEEYKKKRVYQELEEGLFNRKHVEITVSMTFPVVFAVLIVVDLQMFTLAVGRLRVFASQACPGWPATACTWSQWCFLEAGGEVGLIQE